MKRFKLRDYQQEASDAAIDFLHDGKKQNGLIIAPTGCHAKGTYILMYNRQLKKVEDVELGDLVMGDDGTPRKVLKLHHGKDEIYKITPSNGRPFIVNGGHILRLWNATKVYKRKDTDVIYDEVSVSDYLQKSFTYKRIFRLYRSRDVYYLDENRPGAAVDWVRPIYYGKEKKDFFTNTFKIKSVGTGEYYGFTLDGNHLYCDGQLYVHHNSGKSLIIADIAGRLNTNILVLQPNREILLQNLSKLRWYGIDGGVYSASVGRKEIKRITFATIGSIMRHMDDFNKFGVILCDEAHNVSADKGMYKTFFDNSPRKIIGLTATPYRLSQVNGIEVDGKFLPNGSYPKNMYFRNKFTPKDGVRIAHRCIEKFLTRTKPKIFSKLIYNIPIQKLMSCGYLSRPEYYSIKAFDEGRVRRNSTGMDYEESSLRDEYMRSNYMDSVVSVIRRLMHPKRGGRRRGILVFTRFVDDALYVSSRIEECRAISGETPAKERAEILDSFSKREFEVLVNAAVLTTGYDYEALDTVLIARPTMSLSLYTQMVGRVLRIAKNKKTPWVVDMGGNIERFGYVENTFLEEPSAGMYQLSSLNSGEKKILTNVIY